MPRILSRSRAALVQAALVLALPATAQMPSGAPAGQKLDSGLGELPHYSQWLDKSGRSPLGTRVAGESLDSGLGALPHYRHWEDPSGRDPLGLQAQAHAQATRRP